jgi:hypothetical protein
MLVNVLQVKVFHKIKVLLMVVYKCYTYCQYTEYGTHYNAHCRVEQPTICFHLDPDESILQPVLCVKLRFNIILPVSPGFPNSLFFSGTCRSDWHHTHTHTYFPFSLFYLVWTYIRFIPDVGVPIQGHTVSLPIRPQSESC